jgi:hypothetical protein
MIEVTRDHVYAHIHYGHNLMESAQKYMCGYEETLEQHSSADRTLLLAVNLGLLKETLEYMEAWVTRTESEIMYGVREGEVEHFDLTFTADEVTDRIMEVGSCIHKNS